MKLTKEDLQYIAYRFTHDDNNLERDVKKHRDFVDSIPKILQNQEDAEKWNKFEKSIVGSAVKHNHKEVGEIVSIEVIDENKEIVERLKKRIEELEKRNHGSHWVNNCEDCVCLDELQEILEGEK